MFQRNRISDRCPATTAGALALGAALLLWNSAAVCQDQERPRTEREVAQRQLEVMRLAIPALREAEREEAAELLQRAIRAREVTLEGRRDDEAHQIRERSPNRAAQAEVLGLAARLWKEFGRTERAQAVRQLSEQLAARDRRQGDRREGTERRERDVDLPREVRMAIDQLREHGHSEIAGALQRRVVALLREAHGRGERDGRARRERDPAGREIRRREVRREGEQRQERELRRDADRDLTAELQHAVHQLRAELNEIRERPPVHPGVRHVIRELSAEVKRLRAELKELRAAFSER